MIHKECRLYNIKDCMKIEFFGFGMSDLDSMDRNRGLVFINGNV